MSETRNIPNDRSVPMQAEASFYCGAHEGRVQKGAAFETTEERADLLEERDLARRVHAGASKADLYERAQELDIGDRSKMSRDELAVAVAEAENESPVIRNA